MTVRSSIISFLDGRYFTAVLPEFGSFGFSRKRSRSVADLPQKPECSSPKIFCFSDSEKTQSTRSLDEIFRLPSLEKRFEQQMRKSNTLFKQIPFKNSMDDNGFENNILCSICAEIFHQPVSLLPCLHVFCAGCISQWITKNHSRCPLCRTNSEALCKNEVLQLDCESFLVRNPTRARPLAETHFLDDSNIVQDDVVQLSKFLDQAYINIYANNRYQALEFANVLIPLGIHPSSIHYQTIDHLGNVVRRTL